MKPYIFYGAGKNMYHFIAKPLKGKKAKLYDQIETVLKERKIEYELHLTTRKGEARELAGTYSKEAGNVIVVIGGDGTLNDVLHGIHPENAPLGLIPAGTGNDFADSANIPHGLPALELILNSQPKITNYIAFSDGRKSLNIAGLGIDVDILERCEKMKHFHAKSKYFLSLLKSLFSYRGCKIKVKYNGEEVEGNMLLAAICNGKQFGGGIPICPPAEIDDGLLDLVFVDCPSRLKIPAALIKLMRGKVLSLPFAHYARCEEAEFIPATPFTAQYDGELYHAESFSAKVMTDLRLFRG